LAWFFRCFRISEQGWYAYQTPDDSAIMNQDAYFWQALETIGRKLNEMIAHERSKIQAKARRR
jgi:hypothetical protein